jgi:hypothetical protein
MFPINEKNGWVEVLVDIFFLVLIFVTHSGVCICNTHGAYINLKGTGACIFITHQFHLFLLYSTSVLI